MILNFAIRFGSLCRFDILGSEGVTGIYVCVVYMCGIYTMFITVLVSVYMLMDIVPLP